MNHSDALAELDERELRAWCHEHHDENATDEEYCPACGRLNALEAGIPRAVIEEKGKLLDYFSQEYIDSQRYQNPDEKCDSFRDAEAEEKS